MEDKEKPSALEDLDARLKKARGHASDRRGDDDSSSPQQSGMGTALKIGVELVASVAVGVGIGYLLDQAAGTTPWGMVVFFFIGAAAGIRNAYRVALGMPDDGASDTGKPKAGTKGEDTNGNDTK